MGAADGKWVVMGGDPKRQKDAAISADLGCSIAESQGRASGYGGGLGWMRRR